MIGLSRASSTPALARITHAVERLMRSRWPPILAALVVILGAKFVLIASYGTFSPFVDQWEAEADRLFVPWLRGQLTWPLMFEAHNEHRILFSRLLFLGLLEAAGTWNVTLEMAIDAIIHVALLGWLVWLLRRTFLPYQAPVLAALLILLFAVPFDNENTLWGFQSQFYFLLAMSLGAVVLLMGSAPLSWRWLCGLALAALGMLNMASALLTPLAVAATLGLQMALGSRPRTAVQFAGIAALLATAAALSLAVVVVPMHAPLKAHSPLEFVSALARVSGWPFKPKFIAPLLLNAPMAVLAYRLWRERPPASDPRWRLIALSMWLLVQFAAMAYARFAAPTASRYLDILSLNVIINLCAVFVIAPHVAAVLRSVWLGLVATALIYTACATLPWEVTFDRDLMRSRDNSLAAYSQTRDPRAFDRPRLAIPHVSADALVRVLKQPEVLGLLPRRFGVDPVLRDETRARLRLRGGLSLEPETVFIAVRRMGYVLLALGVGAVLFLLGHAMTRAETRVGNG